MTRPSFQSYQGSIFTGSSRCRAWTYCSFQSYQGSIFTRGRNFHGQQWSIFQSYQGSIFTGKHLFSGNVPWNFQSYQGSIFTDVTELQFEFFNSFQSYQGSIFTDFKRSSQCKYLCLSILSRFYFYCWMHCRLNRWAYSFNPIKVLFLHSGKLFNDEIGNLSILSRFYFYAGISIVSTSPMDFQSYQGSIFTCNFSGCVGNYIIFQSYQGSIFTRFWYWVACYIFSHSFLKIFFKVVIFIDLFKGLIQF